MGVQGLWEILQVTSQSRALAHLAVVDGFEDNASGRRAFRVGIDASLWYQHATAFVKYATRDIGANPDIRCLFFRLCNLSELPILPLFVFDGRNRPKVKRGSKKGKAGSHNLTQKMKEMLDLLGMEWRMAMGEAEAELAYLNRAGVIDAIMTDDADAFLFGAQTIIRNPSLRLTGNRSEPALNADGKASGHHVKIFSADAIRNHPQVRLTRGGMILIALLSGGDYDHGIMNCGPTTAHALALCGFGDLLLNAYQTGPGYFKTYLPQWRNAVNEELRTNSQGKFTNRLPGIRIPDTFPDLTIMEAYANPVCSGRGDQEAHNAVHLRDKGDLSLSRAAGFCEAHFDEWGHRSAIIKRFRDLMWDSAVMNVLRRSALETDDKEKNKRSARGERDLHIRGPLTPALSDAVGTPTSLVTKYLSPAVLDPYADIFVNRGSQPQASTSAADPYPLIKEIVGERRHVSTDHLLEYRVVINPRQLVDLTQKGIKGKHPETGARAGTSEPGTPRTPKKPPPEPYSAMRLWLPASMMRQVHPGLVSAYERAKGERATRKAGGSRSRGGRRAASADLDTSDESESGTPLSSPTRPQRSQQSRGRTNSIPYEPEPRASSSQASQASRGAGRKTTNPRRSSVPSFQTSAAPRRIFHNVGLIDDEFPTSDRAFLFTFTNPDDPDMTVWDHDELDAAQAPGLTVTDSNVPGPFDIPSVASARRTGKQREMPVAAADDGDDDDWEPPPLPPSQLDKYNDMFDRILGVKPPQSKGKGRAAKPKAKAKATAPRARPRTQTASKPAGPSRPSVDPVITLNDPQPRAPKPAPRRRAAPPERAPAPESDEDDWEPEPLAPSRLDRYDDLFDRALGIKPSQPKAKATTSRAAAKTAPTARKRPRAVPASSAEGTQQTKRRKTANTAVDQSRFASSSATPPRPATTVPKRKAQPFPEFTPSNGQNDGHPPLEVTAGRSSRPRPRPVPIPSSQETAYPSSSQESGLRISFADVMVFKDLT